MSLNESQPKYELIVAPGALRDFQDIWNYVADDNPNAAAQEVENIWKAITSLGEFPGSGHSRVDLVGNRLLRFLGGGKYLILYRALPSSIEIAAVLHGSRDIPAVLRDREGE